MGVTHTYCNKLWSVHVSSKHQHFDPVNSVHKKSKFIETLGLSLNATNNQYHSDNNVRTGVEFTTRYIVGCAQALCITTILLHHHVANMFYSLAQISAVQHSKLGWGLEMMQHK